MTTPVSVRFRRVATLERLKAEAAERRISTSALAEELIEEGIRIRHHPLIRFRDGPTGRRAGLVNGADIWEVVGSLTGGDIPADDRMNRAIEHFRLTHEQITAALEYYAEFTEEIEAEIAANMAAAQEAEVLWRRRQELLAG